MEFDYFELNNYINFNFNIDSFTSAYESFSLLKKYLVDNNYYLSNDMIEKLISENEKFYNAIDYMYIHYFIEIIKNELNNIDNDILINSINIYVNLNKEQLLIDDSEKDSEYYNESNLLGYILRFLIY